MEITVTGTGRATGQADIATFSVTVESDGPTEDKARQQNNVLTNKALELLKAKIEAKDIRANPAQTYPAWRNEKIIGYQCANTVYVVVHDISVVGELVQQINAIDGVQVQGLRYAIEDNTLENKARTAAFEDAKAKAKLYQSLTVGDNTSFKVVSITESPVRHNDRAMPMAAMAFCAAAESAQDDSEVVEQGEQEVVININVVFQC